MSIGANEGHRIWTFLKEGTSVAIFSTPKRKALTDCYTPVYNSP